MKSGFLKCMVVIFYLALLVSCGTANTNQNFTVVYDGNGNTGGNVPVDSTNYEQGQTVTVLGNPGNLTRTGYSFAGWSTQVNGLGTSYVQGQTFAVSSANVILFAKWTTNPTYTVTYDGNGNTGGSVPTDTTNYEQGQTCTVLGNIGNLVKSGYPFRGWNTQPDGNGVTIPDGATVIITGSFTLYAKWTQNIADMTNIEAIQLSIEATGSLTAPQVVYDRVVTELASIRAAYPSTANITMMPSWNFQQLILGFTDSGKTAVMAGSFSDWNALNNTYAVTNIDKSLLDRLGAVTLTFSRRYNIPLVAAEYAGLTGVRYAEPNGMYGDGNDVCLSIDNTGNHFFIFDAASGDCPAGCTQHAYQGFVVGENGGITEVGTWDSTSGLPKPSWLTDAAACTAWL